MRHDALERNYEVELKSYQKNFCKAILALGSIGLIYYSSPYIHNLVHLKEIASIVFLPDRQLPLPIDPQQAIAQAFANELPIVANELSEKSHARVAEFIEEVEERLPDVVALMSHATEDWDGYVDRVWSSDAELLALLSRRMEEIHAAALVPLFEFAAADLATYKDEARVSLLAPAMNKAIVGSPSLLLSDMSESTFFSNLRGISSMGIKVVNDGAEFIPWFGVPYGLSKIAFDARIEKLLIEPSQQFFATALQRWLEASKMRLLQGFTDTNALTEELAFGWSAKAALAVISEDDR
jgi:hypothetical protein